MRTPKVRAFGGDVRRCEMPIEQRVDRRALRQARMQPPHVDQQPVHVHAGVPVVAAVKRGMQHARRREIGVAAEHMIGFARIFADDVRKRDVGDARGERCVERRQGHVVGCRARTLSAASAEQGDG